MVCVNAPSFTMPTLGTLTGSRRRIYTIFARPSGPEKEGVVVAPPSIGIYTRGLGVPICRPRAFGSNGPLRVVGGCGPSIVIITTCKGVLPGSILSSTGCNYVGLRNSLLPGCENTSPVRRDMLGNSERANMATVRVSIKLSANSVLGIIGARVNIGRASKRLFSHLSLVNKRLVLSALSTLRGNRVAPVGRSRDLTARASGVSGSLYPVSFAGPTFRIRGGVEKLGP